MIFKCDCLGNAAQRPGQDCSMENGGTVGRPKISASSYHRGYPQRQPLCPAHCPVPHKTSGCHFVQIDNKYLNSTRYKTLGDPPTHNFWWPALHPRLLVVLLAHDF